MEAVVEKSVSDINSVDVTHSLDENGPKSESNSFVLQNKDCTSTDTPTGSVQNALNVTLNTEMISNETSILNGDSVCSEPKSISTNITSENYSDVTAETNKENHICGKQNHFLIGHKSNENSKLSKSSSINELKDSFLTNESLCSKNLALSSASLNEGIQETNKPKSAYSKSAENLLTQGAETQVVETSEIDAEKIINDFKNHKIVASPTHKIYNEVPTNENNTKHPKELLAQDIGNIVKNVHGIFSSMSGSIKNAYNISHRVTHKLPQLPIKPPNNKILNEIFDEENSMTKNCENEIADAKIEGQKEIDVKLPPETLESMLIEQKKEMALLKEKLKQQLDEIMLKDQSYKELEIRTEALRKRTEQAEREKDTVVMRYASRERSVIEAQKAADLAAKAEKAAIAEAELLQGKIRSANSEKQRIIQLYDDKAHELSNVERELNKAREDVKEMEGRVKWLQTKLRCEMDAYKDSAEKVEKLQQQVAELEASKENAATNAADTARAKQIESELKQAQADLILCRHEKSNVERRLAHTLQQLDTCKKERDDATAELERCNIEVLELRETNLRLEQEAAELAALRAQAALADTLAAQLERERQRAETAEEALLRERARAETCLEREANALAHAASLTAAHVARAADHGDARAHVQALKADNASLRERIEQLEKERIRLDTALSEETDKRSKETRLLARKVAELTEELAEANKNLEWEKGENEVLKKKHASAIREVNRELHRALKRCDQLEAKIPHEDNRAGSVSSISSSESNAGNAEERLQNGHTSSDSVPEIQVKEPDRQALIERIVNLQRTNARRAERCEFLEEHCKQLTLECKNKSRVLRQLVCAAPPPPNDKHKESVDTLGQEIERLKTVKCNVEPK